MTARGGEGGPEFVELRAHTAFSFGDGAVTPERLVERAAELGYRSVGVTDAADLGGVVRFALAARRCGVRPVVGAELVVDGRPLALLARTAEGCRNLGALVTLARSGELREWTKGGADVPPGGRQPGKSPVPARGFPRLTWRQLAERSAGLHLLTGCAEGALADALHREAPDEARRLLGRYREAFGDRVAVEVQLHDAGRWEAALAGALVELAEQERTAWVVATAPRYVDRAGRRAHDVLAALRAGLTLAAAADRGVIRPNGSWCLASPGDVARRWAGREAGLEASAAIAAACDFELGWLRPPLPRFPVPGGGSDVEYLRRCVAEGARGRWGSDLPEAVARQLEHELAVIAGLGFSGFFLVMWDAVRFARSRNILCQGRGSAANSAVAYALGITAVDPVAHGLLFERFLSAARADGLTEAPDIDVDIEHDRREEVLDYVYGRWRRESAAITCVVQQYSAPTAVQDVMRAFGHPPELATSLSKRLHYREPAEGARMLAEGLAAEFGLDVTTPPGRALLRAVAAFEGLPRMRSTHPGGFVLSSAPLGEYCPVEPTTMGRTVIQFDKDDLDSLGIPKFDFLGLGALSYVRRAFDMIEARTGRRPELYGLPPDDPEAFALIARGDTIGLFQIESRAQIASVVHTRPERLYDIVVQVALIRPGPIVARFVRPYTNRRRGRERVVYPEGLAATLAPILDRTQGIPIFQEQAMALSMALAGYSAADADELRRTMGHQRKLPRLIAALERLRERMTERGIDAAAAAELTEDLQSFANYGFPESHAWSFALIAYATAYLKARHPAEFYAAILNAWPLGFYAPSTLVHDARRHAVEVRPPCLRHGEAACTVEPPPPPSAEAAPARPAFRVGWRFVRGIGDAALERLAAARAERPFASIGDAARRACLTRAEAAALARAGAFAAWEPDRRRAAWAALKAVADTLPLAPVRDGRGDAGGALAPRPLRPSEVVALDYSATGISVTGHPMARWRRKLERLGAVDSAALARCRGGERVIVAGMVTVRQQPATAKGTVFLLLEDECGMINVIVPSALVRPNREPVRHATFLAVYGRAQRDGPLVNVVGEQFKSLDAAQGKQAVVHRSHDFR